MFGEYFWVDVLIFVLSDLRDLICDVGVTLFSFVTDRVTNTVLIKLI